MYASRLYYTHVANTIKIKIGFARQRIAPAIYRKRTLVSDHSMRFLGLGGYMKSWGTGMLAISSLLARNLRHTVPYNIYEISCRVRGCHRDPSRWDSCTLLHMYGSVWRDQSIYYTLASHKNWCMLPWTLGKHPLPQLLGLVWQEIGPEKTDCWQVFVRSIWVFHLFSSHFEKKALNSPERKLT